MKVKQSAQVLFEPQRIQVQNGQVLRQPYTGAVVDGSIGFQTLKEVVSQRVLMQMAQKEGVKPNDADVVQELENRKKDNPNFLKDLVGRGLTLEFIKSQLAMELARTRLITKGVTVEQTEVDDFIKNNPRQFVNPAQVDLYYMVVRDAKTRDQADAELRAGTDFAIVADRYSIDKSAKAMGYRLLAGGTSQVVEAYPPQVQKIIRETKEGATTNWIRDGQNFVKMYIRKKTPESKIEINDRMKERVRQALALERGRLALDLDRQLVNAIRDAKVEINDSFFKEPWKQFTEQLKTATSATTGGTDGTASPAPAASPAASPAGQ